MDIKFMPKCNEDYGNYIFNLLQMDRQDGQKLKNQIVWNTVKGIWWDYSL